MDRRVALVGLVALAACGPADPDPQLVVEWLRTTRSLASRETLNAPVTARVSAYTAIALYEGYAADPRSRLQSLAGQVNGLWSLPATGRESPVDGATAAAEAARLVLDSLFAGGVAETRRVIDSLAKAQSESRGGRRVGRALRDRSVLHGRALGSAILLWASTDGFQSSRRRAWRAQSGAGQWVAAGNQKALEPHWGTLRTFALRNGDECAPPPAPAYSQRPGSDFWKMGKELYDSAMAPTAEQRAIALFWADSSGLVGAPGVRWFGFLEKLITRRRLSADQAAEAYMLTAVAMADGFIGCWRQQYRSMVVRPATFVNRVFDAKWNALSPPPSSPAHPSSVATVAGAAAEVLTLLFGDSTAFADSSQVASGAPPRAFAGFSAARDEAAMAGVYGGVDYLPAALGGVALGECVGQRVAGRLRTRPSQGKAE